MEDIKLGEYVRTDVFGIDKVKLIDDKGTYINILIYKSLFPIKCKIIKHSFNLIDLIEEGDLIEKSEVYEIGFSEEPIKKWVHTVNGFLYYNEELEGKTILTKEQYNSNKYVVKE